MHRVLIVHATSVPVILANAGHFPAEIDAAGLIGAMEVTGQREYADDLLTLELSDGRRVHLLARGHMFDLAGPRPLGNSIESMDLGFALQADTLEAVANRSVDAASCVVPVPGRIDAAIASSYLDRRTTRPFRGSCRRLHQQVAARPGRCGRQPDTVQVREVVGSSAAARSYRGAV